MFRPAPCCGVCLCWIYISVLLHGTTSSASTTLSQHQLLNVTVVQDKKDADWELPFLQLRAWLSSYSRPIRPYSPLTNAGDYHYTLKPQHQRPSQLMRLLGPSFNPFWMSVEKPSEASGVLTSEAGQSDGQPVSRGDTPPATVPNYTTARGRFNLSASPELTEAAANYQQKLQKEVTDLDLGSLPPDVATAVRDRLVRMASCGLCYQWVNLGPAFWPRWLRQTDCEKSHASCSFPSGMECMRAQTTHIRLLAWHCWQSEEGEVKAAQPDGSTEMGTGEAKQKCVWRKVPYPVVTACKCACK